MAKVTPWEVTGDIDYDKLIAEFGVKPITADLKERLEKHAKAAGLSLHHYLRRDIFFAHRDLKELLDAHDKGEPWFLYTGRAPSGPVHLGHLVPWYFTKWLQDVFGVELWFQFPDEEKYLFKDGLSWEDGQKWLHENMLDVAAVGFDPEKTHFVIDTKNADLMYPEAVKVARKITFSTAKGAFGFGNDQNIGAIFYTAMQAVPTFLPSILSGKRMRCLIPHAIDQDPHFRVTRDVVEKLGHHKPASIQCRFFPSLKGMQEDGKMSSSQTNVAVLATDDPKTVKKKINTHAFSGGQPTVEEHREKGGDPDIDVAYQWLIFFEQDDEKLREYHDKYRSGDLLSGELKALLIEHVNGFLESHQERRETLKGDISAYLL